jgi:hypothetical protein
VGVQRSHQVKPQPHSHQILYNILHLDYCMIKEKSINKIFDALRLLDNLTKFSFFSANSNRLAELRP